MSDSEHPKGLPSDDVGYIIRKYPKVDSTISARPKAIKLRVVCDPQDASVHLIFESSSESGPGFFVEGNRVEKLSLRLLDETDSHGTKRASAERITSS